MIANLTVTDYMEAPLVLLGWIVNSKLWDILSSTGLALVPLIAMLVSEWFRGRREGDDEGNKGRLVLNRVLNTLLAVVTCYATTCLPAMDVSVQPNTSTVRLNSAGESCGMAVIGQGNWSQNTLNSMSGDTAGIPLWWALVHVLSKGLTNAAITAIPCTPDWQAIATEVDLQSITDPILKREVGEFQHNCYGQARSKLFRSANGLSEERAEDTDWIGSTYFLDTAGYYDSFYSTRPIIGFPYNEARDAGRNTTGPGMPGYPSCKEWWSTDGVGLKARLYAAVDPTLWDYIQAITPVTETAKEGVIRRMISSRVGSANGKSLERPFDEIVRGYRDLNSRDLIDDASGALGAAGAILGSAGGKGGMDMVKKALPMVQYLLIMAIIIALPIVIIASGYSMPVVGTATFALFGVWFLTFWWELARWMSSNLISMLYNGDGNANILKRIITATTHPYDTMVLVYVEWATFLILPAVWMAMLAWAGYQTGSALNNALGDGSRGAQQAGQKMGDQLAGGATKGVGGSLKK
ncbi:conjugal transfer protein TraG N-terminal domain-containing protein [Azotobacter vinelandii]|uniref:conjugal transfer protein TraG N-terminal domain-containing protein n=1 Tax=Azotobacter vinelandii TaxID=354 RepID=UPI0007733154|nr:conjugal transfer protein TraG N-terminal domain-containing protein [Azotobacter vinelandii]